MEKLFDTARRGVATYKLDTCCYVAPLRAGLLCVGYINVLVSVILIIGTATDSFTPTIKYVQQLATEETSKFTCILVPINELAFSVLLLCAAHRRDVALLRVYMYYSAATAALSALLYSIVMPGISVLVVVVVVIGIGYQIYVVFLVRSLLVEIKLQDSSDKNGGLPSETYTKTDPDVETPDEHVPELKKKGDIKINVETIHEAPKLKTIEEDSKRSGATTSHSGATTSPSGAPTSHSGATTSPSGATTSHSGATTSPSGATTSYSGAALKVTITSTTGASKVFPTTTVTDTTVKTNNITSLTSVSNAKVADVAEKGVGATEAGATGRDAGDIARDAGDIARDAGDTATQSGTAPEKGITVKSRRRFWK